MVKLTEQPYWQVPQVIEPITWLTTLPANLQHNLLLTRAINFAYIIGHQAPGLGGISCWQQGLSIADSLLSLSCDPELLAAALLYPSWRFAEVSLDDIAEEFGAVTKQLLTGVAEMDAVYVLHNTMHKSQRQIENCRKMLLSMAGDLRVVLLKLAERLHVLRTSQILTAEEKKQLGAEIFAIYAPLANRLGLGHLKWEMEDLAFRATNAERYKYIAKQLDMRRAERETYIKEVVVELKNHIDEMGIKDFQVSGRAKHIYSIHRKTERKGVDVKDLFDISAVRVLVHSIEDCYRVLDFVQNRWEMIPQEFDDYISTPKENGYRSIHTAVYGPGGHIVEIQIRTYEMHQESELGVAAHWRYKEGGASQQSYEAKINWLREVLSWQGEVEAKERPDSNVLADRVYVFTPNGDIVDLPQGSTPLDFAYYLHTNIGHRCRGAKINGQIVPLTTPLKMGDRIEVLTHKLPSPSRDWLNPNTGYLTTARARVKVAHWFKQQDVEQHRHDGKVLLERELKRFNLTDIAHDDVAAKFNFAKREDLYAALGAGDIRPVQLENRLQQFMVSEASVVEAVPSITSDIEHDAHSTDVLVEGVGNLLTHMAQCCQPVPGEAIGAYISARSGIGIHRKDCQQFTDMAAQHPERVLAVHWAGKQQQNYLVHLTIEARDRQGLARDITGLVTAEKLDLQAMQIRTQPDGIAFIELSIPIRNIEILHHLHEKLLRIDGVERVTRRVG